MPTNANKHLHAVIMAGGSGTRFWPKSRRNRPKQLLRLFGDSTMIQQTADRIEPLVTSERIWVITGADQAEAIQDQLPHVAASRIVSEPCPRDTAPCVGLAALQVSKVDPEGVMVVMPADHVIQQSESFRNTVLAATEMIASDPTVFVTFGIKPTYPETGYGYIEQGEQVGQPGGINAYRVIRFREKPNREVAEQFLASGRFVWNSGIFIWRADAILQAIRTHQPELADGLDRIGQALGTDQEAEVLNREFPLLKKIPIDKAVMEKASNVRVLEVIYDWSDVGDWRALSEFLPSDENGNSIDGPIRLVDTKDCIVIADQGQLIATLGVSDLVIVQSGGATLIARKSEMDKLKTLVEGLGSAGFSEVL